MNRIGLVLTLSLLTFSLVVPMEGQYTLLMQKANKEYELRAFNLAVESYLRALGERPNDLEAFTKLADCYRHLNQMDQAASAYARAAAQEGFKNSHYLHYGLVLKALGRYDEAKDAFLKFAQRAPAVGNHLANTCEFAKANLSRRSEAEVQPASFNSDADDFGPAIFGEWLVFSSARLEVEQSTTDWTGKAYNQLFVTRNDPAGNFSPPRPALPDQPEAYNNGPVAFAPNNQLAAITRNNFVDGTRHIPSSGMKLDLFFSQLDVNNEWGTEIPFLYNGDSYSTGYPCFSPDGQQLYFASDRPGGFGGFDIYVSTWNGTAFSSPQNLGPTVNTLGNEIAPFFDGIELHFASDYHPGFGGYDLFRTANRNNQWEKPENLLQPVNSSYDDYGYHSEPGGRRSFMVSNRKGGAGQEDIYFAVFDAGKLGVRITNASDGLPIPGAIVDFSACNQGSFTANAQGLFLFRPQSGLSCNVEIRAPGYLPRQVPVSTLVQGGDQPELEISLIRGGELYRGQVKDFSSQLPLAGVQVEATNVRTGSTAAAVTDQQGFFQLALQPSSVYDLKFSRSGYQSLARRVEAPAVPDPSLLGGLVLYPIGSDPAAAASRGRPVETSGRPAGYAIQVAALREPSPSRFQPLESIGSVYNVEQGNLYKVRVGTYATKAEAESALQRVKSSGYPKAFIVEEAGAPATRSGSQARMQEPPASAGAPVGSGRYHVQLAAYRNASNFKREKVASLGQITEKQRGDLTVFYLSAFSDLSNARTALGKARQSGFSGAYLVEQQADGSLKRIQ